MRQEIMTVGLLNINKDTLLQEDGNMLITPVLLTLALTFSKMATEAKLQLQIMLRNAISSI